MLIFTQKVDGMLKDNYRKQLKEIEKLDQLKLEFDYHFYNDIVIKKTEIIINDIIDNELLLENVLIKELCMSIYEYNDLENYEKEVIHEEIYDILEYEIEKLTQF